MLKYLILLPLIVILFLPVLLAIVGAAVFTVWKALTFETRFRRFFSKYDSNEELARMIAARKIWTGQSAAELRDSRGQPVRTEKTGNREIWIYPANPLTKTILKITLEDGRVVNWQ